MMQVITYFCNHQEVNNCSDLFMGWLALRILIRPYNVFSSKDILMRVIAQELPADSTLVEKVSMPPLSLYPCVAETLTCW